MSKRVAITPRPTTAAASASSADQWVENREALEPTKRLTVDLPQSLHARIKAACAERGTLMVQEIRELLHEKYGKN